MSLGPLVHEQRLVLTVLTVLFNLLPYLTATIFLILFFHEKFKKKYIAKLCDFSCIRSLGQVV